jgi:hypothetical protein
MLDSSLGGSGSDCRCTLLEFMSSFYKRTRIFFLTNIRLVIKKKKKCKLVELHIRSQLKQGLLISCMIIIVIFRIFCSQRKDSYLNSYKFSTNAIIWNSLKKKKKKTFILQSLIHFDTVPCLHFANLCLSIILQTLGTFQSTSQSPPPPPSKKTPNLISAKKKKKNIT